MFRYRGQKRRKTLGRYPAIPLAEARDLARDVLLKVAKGEDVSSGRPTQSGLFSDFAHSYIEEYAKPNKSSWDQDEAHLKRHVLPAWGRRELNSIDKTDVIAFLRTFQLKQQYSLARNLKALLSKMFNWGIATGLIEQSPLSTIQLNIPVNEKDRVLSDSELVKLWASWKEMKGYWEPYFQLLLLTAQRRTEVASILWEEIEDDVWTIPSQKNKGKRTHSVPLSNQAMTILNSVPASDSDFIFPSRRSVDRHMSGFTKAMRKSRELSGVTDWTIHDLRRTAASGLARLKVPVHIISAILNHSNKSTMGITAIYNRYEYLDEKKEALEAWSNYVVELVDADSREENSNSTVPSKYVGQAFESP